MKFPRSSGILLHPTSLPGPFGSGDLGTASRTFIDWLAASGQSLWQMLPIGPAGMANSPYMSLSAFAGSPLLIDLEELASFGWLTGEDLTSVRHEADHRVDFQKITGARMRVLAKAAGRFCEMKDTETMRAYEEFCRREKSWLDDYALFQALNQHYGGQLWVYWDADLVRRKSSTLKKAEVEYREYIDFHKFTQWCFDRQWTAMKKYAAEHGVSLIGDIPIFVAHHSSDVWSSQEEFSLDEKGMPLVVAGVPPDYFSEDGQRWGNPLYRWDVMARQGYEWWIERFRKTFELFDYIRLDHFRGFEGYWEIPAAEKTARVGKWVKGPGAQLFESLKKKLGPLPIIAEDLGVITPQVRALRNKFRFPGMKVLQFAFSADPVDHFLPHNFDSNCVVYTGTHDNDTTVGWYEKTGEHERDFVRRYCMTDGRQINWDLIRLALQSVANFAVIPMQDVLSLGSEHRMNYPGTVDGNWEWRFTWDQVTPLITGRLYDLTALYGRCKSDRLNLIPLPDAIKS